MINSANWSDLAPIRTNTERPPPATGQVGLPATAAPAIASPLRSSITLPATASQVAEGRRFVASFVADPTLAVDAALCLSEVATNAVIHSNSRHAAGQFTVSAERCGDGHLRIEVEDQGGRWMERAKAEGQQHRGLMIVSRLASAWGIEGDGCRRRKVWFELRPVPAPPRSVV
jgi:anti-sigma regulatory factor (Ser/Thr protein kinase)